MIRQGDVFWLDLGTPLGSRPGYRHPHVVVQNNVFNQSAIATTVVCSITSNLARGNSPGNVRLNKGEANLSKPSIVNVSQVWTIDKQMLVEKIGSLSKQRISQVLAGIHLLLDERELED